MTSDDNREKKYISFSANDIPMQLADLIDQRNTALKENKELKMRIKELEEEIEGLYEDLAGEDI